MKKYSLILLFSVMTFSLMSQELEVENWTYLYSSPFYSWEEQGMQEPTKLLKVEEKTVVKAIGFYLIGNQNRYVGDVKVIINDQIGWISSMCFNSQELRSVKKLNTVKEEITNDKEVYSDGIVTMFFIDDDFNYFNEVPFGRNVIITKDLFFKRYEIELDIPDGKTKFDLRFLQVINENKIRVKDVATSKVVFFELEDILHKGQLMLIDEKYFEKNGKKFKMMFLFENLKQN